MDQEVLRINFTHPIPLFPLPNCVLLPHATIPLHIFEHRYCAMTSDSLDSRGLIAMASFDGNQWASEYEENPPVRSHVCIGYIIKHRQLKDGRYDLLLQGVCRARILEEIDHDPYRAAMLEPTESQSTMEIDLDSSRHRIETLLGDETLKSLKSVNAIHNWLSREVPTVAVVDLAIMTLCDNAEQRYTMLAEPNATIRARWLERRLRDTRRTLTIANRLAPAEGIDGVHLN